MATAGKPRVVSGMRPTGKLHLGHLVGALNNWSALQDQYDCFYFVADWHALTSDYANTSGIVESAYDMAADWIAGGLDPERSTIFVQSLVPEHAELYLLLSMTVPIPWLERVPTYKEQIDQLAEKDLSTLGFLGYPLLQTADIIIYNAHYVPVGEDQVAHLELSREIVRRYHNFYGELFVEPQPLLTKFARLPGLDNRKMSKSYGNAINIADDAETVRKKVMQMYTDPKRVRADVPGTVEGNPVFIYHDAFNPNVTEVDDLKERYRAGTVGDVEVKKKLAAALNTYLDPMRTRRNELIGRPDTLRDILHEGSRKARVIAQKTMERVRAAAKLKHMTRNMHEDFESILENYPVRLVNFEGPLDLLLHLIKRHEVSIYDIPITTITRQYLEYIDLMTELNLDVAGEFLVMAATLIHIKSRMLLPRADPTQEDPEEDPREALVRRLLEHQKFKAAAELLHERETLRSAQWTRPDGPIAEIAGEAPEPEVEVDLFSLISAFRNVVERAKQRPKVYLPSEQIPIEDRIEQLMARLSETEACGFEDLFADVESRAGLIVTFLAMLEMIRLKLVRVFQSGVVGPIRIYKRARPADAPKPLGDPEQKHADIVRLADEVAQALADEAQASANEARASAAEASASTSTSDDPKRDPGDEPPDR